MLLAEPLPSRHGHGQRVAQGQGGGSAGGRREIHRTGFFRDGATEREIGCLTKRGGWVARQGDEFGAQPPDGLEQANQLVGLAAVRKRDDDIAGLNDPEIAVNRLRRVQKDG